MTRAYGHTHDSQFIGFASLHCSTDQTSPECCHFGGGGGGASSAAVNAVHRGMDWAPLGEGAAQTRPQKQKAGPDLT